MVLEKMPHGGEQGTRVGTLSLWAEGREQEPTSKPEGSAPQSILLGRAAVSGARGVGWVTPPAAVGKGQCSLLGELQPYNRTEAETLTG